MNLPFIIVTIIVWIQRISCGVNILLLLQHILVSKHLDRTEMYLYFNTTCFVKLHFNNHRNIAQLYR